MSSSAGHATRSSSGSGSSERKRPDASQQASQIEKSVTHLLVATKQLLETLTQWSRGSASESDVSDVYVRLGYEFNIACRAFSGVGIETSDLGPVPDVLRSILEDTLSQEASQQSLDRYLPRIRDIIINLLHGLKRKQQKLRQKTGRTDSTSTTTSVGSLAGSTSTTNSTLVPPSSGSPNPQPERVGMPDGSTLPPRTSSFTSSDRATPHRRTSEVAEGGSRRSGMTWQPSQHMPSQVTSDPVLPTPTVNVLEAPSLPPPYPEENTIPSDHPGPPPVQSLPAPPPIPRQQDALSALQRGGDLERRASRRFSAYQISKHLGVGVQAPMPPPQTTPIPNRGREVRESMQAVRMRSINNLHSRGRSRGNLSASNSPNRTPTAQTELKEQQSQDSVVTRPQTATSNEKITNDTIPEQYGDSYLELIGNRDVPGARLSGPGELDQATYLPPSDGDEVDKPEIEGQPAASTEPPPALETQATPVDEEVGGQRPDSSDPLTLFLQYKTKVKKFVLATGYKELTLPRLQLAFIEKFSWNTHSNGADLPDIYVQDQSSGIRHELEDLNDVKNNSVLVLNVDDMDEMKRHFDEGFGSIRKIVEDMHTAMSDQQIALQKVSQKQVDAAKDIARLASAPPTQLAAAPSAAYARANGIPVGRKATPSQLSEVQDMRRDLAVMKQMFSTHNRELEVAMGEVREKVARVKTAAAKTADLPSGGEGGRSYVNARKKALTDDSEKIINRVDDIQDIIEELRKDVVSRGVRPLPKQLEKVSREIQTATGDLNKFRESMKREKAIWGKVHEDELQAVCDDQEVLRVQEEFAADLEDDLEKAAQTFILVEQATKQQMVQGGAGGPGGGAPRQASRNLGGVMGDVDPLKAKDGVLGEVRALQPNHESRLEAIERAERLRRAELESRRDGEFKRELGQFVEMGKLKKSGGVDEVERLRLIKDQQAFKENWERAAARAMQQEMDEAQAAAEVEAEALDETPTEEEGEFVEAPEPVR